MTTFPSYLFPSEPFAPFYDAEYHLGLVAENDSSAVASENTSRLNDALAATWQGGRYPFERIPPGPVLYPIVAAAKEFYFNGTILGPAMIGGALRGMGARGYSLAKGAYDNFVISDVNTHFGVGGAVTRFTRLDGQNGGACIRLRGVGFRLDGINFKGRPYYYDPTGNGPDDPSSLPAGTTATPVGIEVEGRPFIATGGQIISNCSIDDCTYGICCRAGYYDDHGVFQSHEDNADTSHVSGVVFNRCPTIFRSESQQAVCWHFHDLVLNAPTALLLDIPRGGNIHVDAVWSSCWAGLQLIRVRDYSQNNSRITIRDLKMDHASSPTVFFTVFEYTGETGNNVYWRKWSIRVEGAMNNFDAGSWDPTQLIKVPLAAEDFPLDDILIDITGMPEDKFTRQGRWLVPTSAWQS